MGFTFNAFLSSSQSNVTGDGTSVDLVCDQVLYNQNSIYDNTTGQMTSVGSSNFCFQGNVCLGGLTSLHTSILVELITTNQTYNVADIQGINLLNSSVYQLNFSQIAYMNSSDTAFLRITVGGSFKTVDVLGSSTISRTSFGAFLPVV
jgi:hypothetical protein